MKPVDRPGPAPTMNHASAAYVTVFRVAAILADCEGFVACMFDALNIRRPVSVEDQFGAP